MLEWIYAMFTIREGCVGIFGYINVLTSALNPTLDDVSLDWNADWKNVQLTSIVIGNRSPSNYYEHLQCSFAKSFATNVSLTS